MQPVSSSCNLPLTKTAGFIIKMRNKAEPKVFEIKSLFVSEILMTSLKNMMLQTNKKLPELSVKRSL